MATSVIGATQQNPLVLSASAQTTACRATAERPQCYLCRLGYKPGSFESSAPELSICVTGHSEFGGHTYYKLCCELQWSSNHQYLLKKCRWSARRRLADLRLHLHDWIKSSFGRADYAARFGDTPFAMHGGIPGTTARLHAWMATLATCANNDDLSAPLLTKLLQFLRTPLPEIEETNSISDLYKNLSLEA